MPNHKPDLVRGIGRWSLAALMVNFIIGAGIFGLPSTAAGMLGGQSPIAYVIAAAGMGVIAACVAEVASRFHQAGGPYLYARVAFGRFLGLQTGWLLWLSRVSSAAAIANVFLDYLAGFWPQAQAAVARVVILTLLIGALALINIRGVTAGTKVGNFLTAAKILPLAVLVIGGLLFIQSHGSPVPVGVESHSASAWLNTILLLVFAFGGFEAALVPAGEFKDAARDVSVALMGALALVTTVYCLVQVVVIRLVANPAQTDRPLSAAAQVFGGNAVTTIVAAGALLSTFGTLAANMTATPRLTFAFSEHGDFPAWFAAVHRRYHTPYVSIAVFAILFWGLAVTGSFRWNAALSAISRLFAYAVTCAALPRLRQKFPGGEGFHLRGGMAFAALGIAFILALVSRISLAEVAALGITVGISSLNWLAVRGKVASVELDR